MPDREWAADITSVPTREGWLYLAGVTDLCGRKIVGWAMADPLETDLVADALMMAIETGKNGCPTGMHLPENVGCDSHDCA